MSASTLCPDRVILRGDRGLPARRQTSDRGARGRILITGDSATSESDQRDAFLTVLDDHRRPLAEHVWTSDGDDVPAAIAVDACGTATIVGHTTGDLGGAARGGDDAFLIVTSDRPE